MALAVERHLPVGRQKRRTNERATNGDYLCCSVAYVRETVCVVRTSVVGGLLSTSRRQSAA